MMGVQMAAAPAPYGIDNVVYGSAPAAYGAVALSPYQTMATPAYAATAPAYAAAAAPSYAVARLATLRLMGRSPVTSAASRRPDRTPWPAPIRMCGFACRL